MMYRVIILRWLCSTFVISAVMAKVDTQEQKQFVQRNNDIQLG